MNIGIAPFAAHKGKIYPLEKMEDCIQKKLPCRPCSIYGNKPCLRGDMACMDIEPEEIISRIIQD